MSNDVRLQSSLGGISRFERKDHKMDGALYVGKVTKVHHKHHTADVVLLEHKDQIVGSNVNEGISACKILERHAGWDSEFESFYGDSTPIQVGEIVVVGFLNNYKARPIILGTLHELENEKNPFPEEYPLDELEQEQKFAHLSITRTQDYKLINGNGEIELAHHSKAFMVASERDIDDSKDGFDYANLSVKNKLTNEVVGVPELKRPFLPLDFLISLRDSFSKTANFLKLWVSAKTGEFRLSKIKADNTLTTTEIDEDGAFKVTRQLDSNVRGKSNNYSSVSLQSSGEIKILRSINGTDTIISIGSSGEISISTKNSVNLSSSKEIDISSSSRINITAPIVNISE
jgi:hypothetical protein